MKRTIWISAMILALLCLTCMAYATDPNTVWTTPVNVSIGVTPYATVTASSPIPLIMCQGGLTFNVFADFVATGTVPCTISGTLSSNNIPAGVTLYVRFADPDLINGVVQTSTGLAAMEAECIKNGDNNYVGSIFDLPFAWKVSGSSVCTWTSASGTTAQSFNVTTPTTTYGTSWPVIYSVCQNTVGPSAPCMPQTSVLTYTLAPTS